MYLFNFRAFSLQLGLFGLFRVLLEIIMYLGVLEPSIDELLDLKKLESFEFEDTVSIRFEIEFWVQT